ncbi:MAG: glycosyltransferase family 4 protein [Cyclobacteriaceae bacterium]
MKIAFQFYDKKNYSGGPAVNAVRLLTEFQNRGHEVHALISYSGDYPNARLLMDAGIQCHLTELHKFTEDAVMWFMKEIEKAQPDIFVTNISCQAGFSAKWIMKAGIPCIIAHRSDDKRNWGLATYFASTNYGFKHSGVICVNNYLKSVLEHQIGDHPPIKVIPSGVAESKFKTDQKNWKPIKFVYSGRLLEGQKRVSEMLAAFKLILKHNFHAELTLIGSDSDETTRCYERKTLSLGIEDSVRILPKKTNEDYKRELSKNHILLLMSDYEGLPGSVMDGMSCGLIPVVLKFNGVEDLIINGYNGIVLTDRSYSFVDAVELLEQNLELRIKLSTNAVATIENNFTTKIAADLWESFMRDCITHSIPKRHFKKPQIIELPQTNPLLVEDKRKPTLLKKIKNHFTN